MILQAEARAAPPIGGGNLFAGWPAGLLGLGRHVNAHATRTLDFDQL